MKNSLIALTALLLLSVTDNSWACAVCFGDPNSPLFHGAKVAVYFMLGVVGVVLGLIAGVAIFWIRRARLLQVQAALRGESTEL